MNLQLYNTVTLSKESFTPIAEGSVSMYHCGPTAYTPTSQPSLTVAPSSAVQAEGS